AAIELQIDAFEGLSAIFVVETDGFGLDDTLLGRSLRFRDFKRRWWVHWQGRSKGDFGLFQREGRAGLVGVAGAPGEASDFAHRDAALLQYWALGIEGAGSGNQLDAALMDQGNAITEGRKDVGIL